MTLQTNLKGRLRNTSLPASQGLLALFEAVVNSIQSIEEAGLSPGDGRISIEIHRSLKDELAFDGKAPNRSSGEISGFTVTDNGAGFTEANMASFRTLDSDHRADKGGRGVGRLMWLKAFREVAISSGYEDATLGKQQRTFNFDADRDITDEIIEPGDQEWQRKTRVHLNGFQAKYREAAPKTAQPIANSILEHCLWYFVRQGGAPLITVQDEGTSLLLDNIFEEHMHTSAVTEECTLKENLFTFTHIKLRATSTRNHGMALCAANRLVKRESLAGKIPGLFGRLRDETGEFMYACYVNAQFLDEHVRPERTGFNISERPEVLFAKHDLSLEDIRKKTIELAAAHLDGHLAENRSRAKERVEQFVAEKAPRYRTILSRVPEENLALDPEIPDKDLELALHRELAEIESELITEGHALLSPRPADELEDYEGRIAAYLQKAEDIKKSDLAGYVSHRRVIIDLLAKAIERSNDGTYAREDLIHQLIMPMRVDSNEVRAEDSNLWLVDERLAFHHHLASDKSLASMPVTGSTSATRPDLVAFNVFDNPMLASEEPGPSMASIVVVELKKPMRNDAKPGEDHDPIEQALGYVKRIRNGGVKTASGRPIPESQEIPGFCYILCDLTPTMIDRCRSRDATRTADGMGFFFYHRTFHTYVEVSSFDRVVKDATRRNRAFFDQLGLPTV